MVHDGSLLCIRKGHWINLDHVREIWFRNLEEEENAVPSVEIRFIDYVEVLEGEDCDNLRDYLKIHFPKTFNGG